MSTIYHKELSDIIIGTAFRVHTKLGSGLPEACYERALLHDFFMQDILAVRQQKFDVHYDNELVGHFYTDIVVENKIILELKSDERITDNHISQLMTYLRVTNYKVGYLLNFGARSLIFKRLIL